MADKSTKTDDALLNGELVCTSGSKPSSECARPTAASVVGGRAPPTTANASTMTSHILTEARPAAAAPNVAATPATPEPPPPSTGGSRLSYAQVAQHHRERAERLQREKQAAAQQAAQHGNTAAPMSDHQDKRKSDNDDRSAPSRQTELRGKLFEKILPLRRQIY